MTFSNDILLRAAILVLAVCGFFVAKHIHKHKKENKPLVCPVGFDCNSVVHSDYSKFMGIPVEVFGMVYYALVAIFYLYFIFDFDIFSNMLLNFLIFISLIAFLFSLYLIGVQIFVIKKGCSWCAISSLISTAIFIIIAYNYDFSLLAHFIK